MKLEDYVETAGDVDQQDNYKAISGRLDENKDRVVQTLNELVLISKKMDLLKKEIIYGAKNGDVKYKKASKKVEEFLSELNTRKNYKTDLIPSELFSRLFHYYLGIFTESGEMLEALREYLVTGELDLVNLSEEHGDNMWYMARASKAIAVSIEESLETNHKKLNKGRYLGGYSDSKALNRDLDNERSILEGKSEKQD